MSLYELKVSAVLHLREEKREGNSNEVIKNSDKLIKEKVLNIEPNFVLLVTQNRSGVIDGQRPPHLICPWFLLSARNLLTMSWLDVLACCGVQGGRTWQTAEFASVVWFPHWQGLGLVYLVCRVREWNNKFPYSSILSYKKQFLHFCRNSVKVTVSFTTAVITRDVWTWGETWKRTDTRLLFNKPRNLVQLRVNRENLSEILINQKKKNETG